MNKFTIKIDLSSFFEDERKFVIVLVDPKWNKVEFLARRVENIFKLNNKIQFVTEEGYFIPPEEEIEVIKYISKIRAFAPQANDEVKKHKKIKPTKKKRHEHEIVNDAIEMPSQNVEILSQNKRKHCLLAKTIEDFTTSTPKSPHAKRSKTNMTTESDVALVEDIRKKKNSKKKVLSKELHLKESPIDLEIVNGEQINFKGNISITEDIMERENGKSSLNAASKCANLMDERKKHKKKLLKNVLNNELLNYDEIDATTTNANANETDQPTNYNVTAENLNNVNTRPKFNCALSGCSPKLRTFKMKRNPKSEIKILENLILSQSKKSDIFGILRNSNKINTTINLEVSDLFNDNKDNLADEKTKIAYSKTINTTNETSQINKEQINETLKSLANTISKSPREKINKEHSLLLKKELFNNPLPKEKNLVEKNNLYSTDLTDVEVENNTIEFETATPKEITKCDINKTILDVSMNTIDSSEIIDLSESNDNIFDI